MPPTQEPVIQGVWREPSRATCTEAERAYLNAILDGGLSRKETEELRVRIASERLDQKKRAALIRAWADSILARWKWEELLKDVDLGGYGAPLYEALDREALALAESERPK